MKTAFKMRVIGARPILLFTATDKTLAAKLEQLNRRIPHTLIRIGWVNYRP